MNRRYNALFVAVNHREGRVLTDRQYQKFNSREKRNIQTLDSKRYRENKEMREQEQKLANVKKSCDVVRKVCKIFGIIMIVVAVIMIVGGIVLLAAKNQINSNLVFDSAAGQIKIVGDASDFISLDDVTIDIETGFFSFDYDGMGLIREGKFGELFALYCFTGALVCAVMAGIFITIQKTFEFIKNSETPFDEKILKRLKAVFVAMTIVFALLSGIGTAIISGVIFWSIYCIIDYGYVLQTEVDETL